jgi:hypothetical protein
VSVAELRISRTAAAALAGVLLATGIATWGASSSGSVAAKARPPANFFGVNAFPLALVTDRDTKVMARGGIGGVRFLINWAFVEPSRGDYVWGPVDSMMARLARGRMRPMPLVSGAPHWAAPSGRAPTKGGGKRAWSRFVKAVVRRYGPRGSFWSERAKLPGDPIRALQIWDEPNLPYYWGGPVSPRGYTKLLRASATAIRAVDPSVKVVLAGLGPGLAKRTQVPSWKFLDRLYGAGAKPYFDVAADHPYAPGVAGMADQLRRVAKVMRRHDDRSPLDVTELGWSSGHLAGSHLEVGRRGQARRLRGAVRFVVRHRRELHIKRFVWFGWRDPARSADLNPDGAYNFGLRHNDEKPKSAWRAYARWTRR